MLDLTAERVTAERVTVEGVQDFLSQTPFAASKVVRLSGGYANFTHRLTLRDPYITDVANVPVHTVILKHAEPYAATDENFPFSVERQELESLAFRLVPQLISPSPVVSLPRLYHEDRENHNLFMSDSGEASTTLKALLRTSPPADEISHILGHSLGTFLARLHTSTSSPDSPGSKVKAEFAFNQEGRFLSGLITYGTLIDILAPPDDGKHLVHPPLNLSAAEISTLTTLAKTMSDRIMSSEDVLTMGDFWTGNLLVSLIPEPRVTVVDWEVAKPGLAGLDIGQFLAECHLLRVFHPSSRASVDIIITSFLTAYREVFLRDAVLTSLEDVARVAVTHFGVHLATWTPRTGWGSKEQERAVVMEGVTHLLHAHDGDATWLRKSIVRSLLL